MRIAITKAVLEGNGLVRYVEIFGSHSLRRGAAQALAWAGWPLEIIKNFGRWLSDVIDLYLMTAPAARAVGALACAMVSGMVGLIDGTRFDATPQAATVGCLLIAAIIIDGSVEPHLVRVVALSPSSLLPWRNSLVEAVYPQEIVTVEGILSWRYSCARLPQSDPWDWNALVEPAELSGGEGTEMPRLLISYTVTTVRLYRPAV